MAEDRVLLKQEEIVGNDVVLNDINPKSNTRSIDDPTTGFSLDKTLDRMWQSINNKLSRIVNSVNGRTGVVVLSAKDVGLENVDNVSLADIKKWVINRMNQEFEYKRITLFEYLDEMEAYIANNDETHKNQPFYSHHGFRGDDERAYIGYIFWDPTTQRLKPTYMVIDTVGYTDNSLIYNETINGNELSGGGLGVNIWKYEDALEIYNKQSGTKENSGLRINNENLLGKVYFFNGVYGDGSDADNTAFLYKGRATQVPTVTLNIHRSRYEEVLTVTAYLRQPNIKYGDIIITNFYDDPLYREFDGGYISGINEYLVDRQPCIGYVSTAPSQKDRQDNPNQGSWNFIIDFYQLAANPGWGLYYSENHANIPQNTINRDSELSVQLVMGIDSHDETMTPLSVSGLNTIKSPITGDPDDISFFTVLPFGPTEILSKTIGTDFGKGLMITPNSSLCVIPTHDFLDDNNNWDPSTPYTDSKPYPTERNHYINQVPSMLGINLMKAIITGDGQNKSKAVNMSGLRINNARSLSKDWGGLNSSINPEYLSNNSGGLSINVGKFLTINPGEPVDDFHNFYDGGKVDVSISSNGGLADDGNNGLSVNINVPLYFNEDGKISLRIVDVDDKPLSERNNAVAGRGLEFRTINGDVNDIGLGVKLGTNSGLSFDTDGGIINHVDESKGLHTTESGIAIKIAPVDMGPNSYVTYDCLKFDEDGKLRAMINTTRGVEHQSSGLEVKLGDGLDFDESGSIVPLLGPGLKFID